MTLGVEAYFQQNNKNITRYEVTSRQTLFILKSEIFIDRQYDETFECNVDLKGQKDICPNLHTLDFKWFQERLPVFFETFLCFWNVILLTWMSKQQFMEPC